MSGEGPSIEQRVGVAPGTPPLIGVSNSELRSPSRVEQLPEGEPPQREIGLGLAYPQAIQRAGGLPVVLPALEPNSVLSLLDRLHGLCLSGGPDLEPSNYARPPHPKLGPTEPEVDRFELALARHADERGMPILAICRGAQVLNVARGGTLHQHLPEVSGVTAAHRQAEPADRSTHQVEVSPESLLARALAGSQRLEVNSFHHQAPERLGDGLRAVAWSTDGVVEGIEAPGREFMVGVQWHAECLLERPEQAALFRSFVEAAARYGAAVDRAHAA